MFSKEPSVFTKESSVDDSAISNILVKIKNKWQQGVDNLEATLPIGGPMYTDDQRKRRDSPSELKETIDDRAQPNSPSNLGNTIDQGIHEKSPSSLDATIDDRAQPNSPSELGGITNQGIHEKFPSTLDATIDDRAQPISPSKLGDNTDQGIHEKSSSELDATIDDRAKDGFTSEFGTIRTGRPENNIQENTDIKETIILSPSADGPKKTKDTGQNKDPNKTVLITCPDEIITDKSKPEFYGNDQLKDTIWDASHTPGPVKDGISTDETKTDLHQQLEPPDKGAFFTETLRIPPDTFDPDKTKIIESTTATDSIPIAQLANEIRKIYVSDSAHSEENIEHFLKEKLKNLSRSESLTVLSKLIAEFGKTPPSGLDDLVPDHGLMLQIYSRLLGKDLSSINLSSEELFKRLTQSLNTLFDSLDQLIKVIDTTLFGENLGKHGIRTIIGSNTESLEDHLGQITKAFSLAMRAFEKTAEIKISEILREIDPDRISAAGGGWLKIAPFRKAYHYEIFEEEYQKIEDWFESGKFIKAFREEFEKNCQILSED